MLEILRKAYLMGLGVAGLSRDKIEEVVDELIKRGEIAEKDRKSVMQDLLTRAKEEQKKFQETVKDVVRKVISEIGVPTRKEFKDLVIGKRLKIVSLKLIVFNLNR